MYVTANNNTYNQLYDKFSNHHKDNQQRDITA